MEWPNAQTCRSRHPECATPLKLGRKHVMWKRISSSSVLLCIQQNSHEESVMGAAAVVQACSCGAAARLQWTSASALDTEEPLRQVD
uniref:Uncharacterized protein n=1 Tax=Arundo donax TaxID=35708 RepID=A0A0A9DLS3_ARUDO